MVLPTIMNVGFLLFLIVAATQASHAPPESGEFAEAPIPSITGTAATLKWCPLGKCLHCCQCSIVFNRPLCSRCCQKANNTRERHVGLMNLVVCFKLFVCVDVQVCLSPIKQSWAPQALSHSFWFRSSVTYLEQEKKSPSPTCIGRVADFEVLYKGHEPLGKCVHQKTLPPRVTNIGVRFCFLSSWQQRVAREKEKEAQCR